MRRTYLRGHTNILKRLLIHAGGFNLGLVMRHLIGSGTPRGLQDRPATVIAALLVLMGAPRRWLVASYAWHPRIAAVRWFPSYHHYRLLLSGDHLHHGLLAFARATRIDVNGAVGVVASYSDAFSVHSDAWRRAAFVLLGVKPDDCPQSASNGNDSGANPSKSLAIGRIFQKRPKNIEHCVTLTCSKVFRLWIPCLSTPPSRSAMRSPRAEPCR
jgi:hypothetical protein